MFLLISIASTLELILNFNFRKLLLPFAKTGQKICVGQFHSPLMTDLGGAMVCGQDLPLGQIRSLFLDLGLYHVLVVSGLHLSLLAILVNFALNRIFSETHLISRIASVLILASFALMTGLNPPVTRALFQFALANFDSSKEVSSNKILSSYLFSIAFCPEWIGSLSLHLSTVATLACLVSSRPITTILSLYFLTFPLIAPLGSLELGSAFIAGLLTPIIELTQMPILFLGAILPRVQPAIEHILQIQILYLSEIHNTLPARLPPMTSTSSYFLIVYTVMVWIFVSSWNGWNRRNWYFKKCHAKDFNNSNRKNSSFT